MDTDCLASCSRRHRSGVHRLDRLNFFAIFNFQPSKWLWDREKLFLPEMQNARRYLVFARHSRKRGIGAHGFQDVLSPVIVAESPFSLCSGYQLSLCHIFGVSIRSPLGHSKKFTIIPGQFNWCMTGRLHVFDLEKRMKAR